MSATLNLLIVDDDDLVIAALRQSLPKGWRLLIAESIDQIPEGPFHAGLIDMHLSRDNAKAEGLEIVRTLRNSNPHLEIISMSGDLDRDLMEKGLKAGASRFLSKPLNPEEVNLTLAKIEEWWLLQGALQRSGYPPVQAWLGQSKQAREVQKQIAALKGESGPILIEGESGTGKEVVARLLHNQTDNMPLIAINLAGIPDALFESEFFGHVRGAFTGADQNKMGLAEAAHGGDLFLDEVEAMPINQQAKLLRFLETGEVRRLGARDAIQIRCRVIAASNQSLQKLVKEGKFREDLMWRLTGKKISLPTLRDRPDDIPVLAASFLKEDPIRRKDLAPDGKEAMMEYHWPGNVRELRRFCEQLRLSAPLPLIRRADVTPLLQNVSRLEPVQTLDYSTGLTQLSLDFECLVIRRCLDKIHDIDEVARTLKISRSNLYKKIKDFNIQWRES